MGTFPKCQAYFLEVGQGTNKLETQKLKWRRERIIRLGLGYRVERQKETTERQKMRGEQRRPPDSVRHRDGQIEGGRSRQRQREEGNAGAGWGWVLRGMRAEMGEGEGKRKNGERETG